MVTFSRTPRIFFAGGIQHLMNSVMDDNCDGSKILAAHRANDRKVGEPMQSYCLLNLDVAEGWPPYATFSASKLPRAPFPTIMCARSSGRFSVRSPRHPSHATLTAAQMERGTRGNGVLRYPSSAIGVCGRVAPRACAT